uniref:Uncharacterized protein n=1 Tax=Propithecus coquereli TaxID=379532 RepID=A0A2K6G8B3_PROCO
MVDLSRWPSRRLGGARSGLGGTPLCSLAQLASAAPSVESPADKQGLQPRTQAPQSRQRRKQKAALHQSHTQGRHSRQQVGGSVAGSAEPEMKVMLSGSLGSGLRVRRLGGGWGGLSYVSRHSSAGCSQGPKRGGPDDGRGCPGRGMVHCMVCCSQAPAGDGGPGRSQDQRKKLIGQLKIYRKKLARHGGAYL